MKILLEQSEKVVYSEEKLLQDATHKDNIIPSPESSEPGTNLGNCKEELPKKPVGRLSVSTGCQQSADCWPIVGRHFGLKHNTNCWPTVGQQSADRWPTVGRQLADCRLTVGQQSADSWATVGRLSADRFFGELFFTITQIYVRQFFS